jgi:hypothetical protein
VERVKKIICTLTLFCGLLTMFSLVSFKQASNEHDGLQDCYKKSDKEVRGGSEKEGIVFF